MVRKWLGSIAGLVTTAGIALGQGYSPTAWTPNVSPFAEIHGPIQPVVYQPEAPPPTPVPAPQPAATTPIATGTDCGVANGPGLWFQADYLLWKVKTGHAGSDPLFGTIPTSLVGMGLLPVGSITPALGKDPSRFDYGDQNGVRIEAGYYLDGAREWSIAGGWFQLENGSKSFQAASSGDPVIGPVFNDTFTGLHTILEFAIPTARTAQLDAEQSNRLWGADLNLRRQIPAIFFADRLDFLVGFRYLQFNEGLDVNGMHTADPGFVDPVARVVSYFDQFGVHNDFYGVQIGLASHSDIGPFTLDLIGKFALGGMQDGVTINGSTTLVDPAGAIGTTVTRPGGVLTQPTNIGHTNHYDFEFVPEITLNFGWHITPRLQATVGYNFLYMNNVYRVGSQIEGVDGRQVFGSTLFVPNALPAPTQPTQPAGASSTFWVQGLTVGLEYKF